ncbi:pygopus homolog 1 [Candoia aspera]|uniref:pygopus homolog 1 n=1 Tax=Candoia aspera TaxID=51853 RepID=UPI002FD85C3D
MSAEHEKEPAAALKRPRGGDGGLEGLAGAGLQLGSPDKKKRKASAQGAPFPAPPSEYAPPPNPSSDHLIAANPFDDSYAAATAAAAPYKPAGSPYFPGPGYPSFGGYNAFRMPPHLLPRMASPYGAPAYPLRSQPHPFAQNSPVGMVFNRPPAVTFGPPENAGFAGQPSYGVASTNQPVPMPVPSQPFRPNPGENFGHMPSQNAGPVPPRDVSMHFGPGPSPAFGSTPVEPNHSYAPGPNSYSQAKPSPKLAANKHQPPPQQQHHHPAHGAEDVLSSGSADVKAAGHRNVPAGNPEGVLPKHMENLNSAHANGTPNKPRLPHGGPEGSSSEKGGGSGGKIPLHPPQHGHTSSEPVYPCGICTHEVNDDQDAILCEASCQKWFHRICTGMTESAYGLLTAEASAVWGCDTCMADKDVQLMRTRETAGPPALNADA